MVLFGKKDRVVMIPPNRDANGNINTLDYWDGRFGSGDWEINRGFFQTRAFAESQVSHLSLPKNFSGSLCDFGCGAGDAFPVYRATYPFAKLIGVDFSGEAIRLCREKYSTIAEFIQGDIISVPFSDIIITSNVLEHLDSDKEVVNELLERCKKLFVIVPYNERNFGGEHLRFYDENSFADLFPVRKVVFLSKGWSLYGIDLWYQVYLKNIARFILGRPLLVQKKQILFEFQGRRK